jgi:nitrate/TMAO reductase-like tetraheme cytochrome c subunit
VGQDSDEEQIEMETRGAAHALFSEDTDMLAAEVQNEMMEDESRHCGDCTYCNKAERTHQESREPDNVSPVEALSTRFEAKVT